MTTYIHGTSKEEQRRLSILNEITNSSFVRFLGDLSNKKVCDLGCGTGNLIFDIAKKYPDAKITGLEISEDQIKIAKEVNIKNETVTLVTADVSENTLPEDHFDVTYCRYLLEHVSDPKVVAAEMIRITKSGGFIKNQENDLNNVIYYPDIPGHETVMQAFCDLQIKMGGDPFVGRKLFDIFKAAGAMDIELSFEPEIYTEDDPERYRAWIENARSILLGARDDLLSHNLVDIETFDGVIDTMSERIERPKGVALFYWNRVSCSK